MERVFKHIQMPLTALDLQERWSAQFKFLGECTDLEFFYGFDVCFFPDLDLFLPPREQGSLTLRYTVDRGIINKDYLPFFFECDSIDFEKKRVCISLRNKYFIHFLKKEPRQKIDALLTEYQTRGKENTEAILDAIEKHEY